MSTKTHSGSTKASVRIPVQPQRGGGKPLGTPRTLGRGRVALAITTVVAAGVAVAAVWMSVGPETPSPPNEGGQPFVSQVPQGIDGSDWRLYQRGIELGTLAQAQLEAASGSDQRFYNLAGQRP